MIAKAFVEQTVISKDMRTQPFPPVASQFSIYGQSQLICGINYKRDENNMEFDVCYASYSFNGRHGSTATAVRKLRYNKSTKTVFENMF
jgi:hypothetical protein